MGAAPTPSVQRLSPSDYQNLEITAGGSIRFLGTSRRASGSLSTDGRKAHFTLHGEETEVRVVEGQQTGGRRTMRQVSGFAYSLQQITHDGKQVRLLRVDWENEIFSSPKGGKQECYSRQ